MTDIMNSTDYANENIHEIKRTRQLISRGHVGKLLDRSQNNWENFLYNRKQEEEDESAIYV